MQFPTKMFQMSKLTTALIFFFVLFIEPVMAEQLAFANANDAARMLYDVIEKEDSNAAEQLFGADYKQLLPVAEINDQDRQQFISDWNKMHELVAGEKDELYIKAGSTDWTFPVPLKKSADGWVFNTAKGAENVRIRRIGRNELAVMQSVLAYYDAQREYAQQDRNGDDALEYAQKFISSPDMQDGLYWPVAEDEAPSPLGFLFATKTSDRAYNGYYYKILKAQDKNAKGGAYNYMLGERMQSGFALIAWPAQYGETGVMSFIINHDGVVYEKDLGPETEATASEITRYDPDSSWVPTEETL